jgi:hypothetical protein
VHRVRATRVALVAVAAAYAWLLATTDPFTVEANVVIVVGLAAGALALTVRLARGRPLPAAAGRSVENPQRSTIPWLALVAVVLACELYCFFGGPRPAHPTLSTLYDLAARWPAVKALVVLAWLALGWELVR